MQGIAARALCRGDEPINIEISCGPAAAQCHRAVGFLHMQAGGIVGGMDGDRFDPHFRGRACNADRDLAAIGDQQFSEHIVLAATSGGSGLDGVTAG